MTPPLVSIAIPAYNHAQFIEATLASVCTQTYPELELVLIDDGSTDDTYTIAKRFLEPRRSRFHRLVLERKQNRGVSENSNACIEACQGEWVHLLGSDDILKPEKVAKTQESISHWHEENLALVHADVDYIDELGNPIVPKKQKTFAPEGIEHNAYTWIFLQKHFIFNPTLALNRRIFLDSGGFDPNLPLEDLDCWLRLSTKHSFARIPEVLASYRKHPGNTSRRRLKMLAAQFDTYANFLENNPNLLAASAITENYHDNLHRFWKRIRMIKPWVYPKVLIEKISTRFSPPSPEDYRKFSAILKGVER
jgi:alpha-1,3-rhamnosyltransferase